MLRVILGVVNFDLQGSGLSAEGDQAGAMEAVAAVFCRGEDDRVQAPGKFGPVGEEIDELANVANHQDVAVIFAGVLAEDGGVGAGMVRQRGPGRAAGRGVLAAGLDAGGGFDSSAGHGIDLAFKLLCSPVLEVGAGWERR